MTKYRIPKKISTNIIYAGKHWRTRQKHKDLYIADLYYEFINIPKPKTPCKLQVDYYIKGRLLDWDNCSYMTKMIQDVLIKAEIIPDDTNKYITGGCINVYKTKEPDYFTIKFI